MKAFQKICRKGMVSLTEMVEVMNLSNSVKGPGSEMIYGKNVPRKNEMKIWETASDAGGSTYCSHTDNGNLIFKGQVIFDSAIAERTRTTGGFAALRGTFEDFVDFRDQSGLEINMRSDKPIILTINVGCKTFFVNDIHQFHFQVKDTWQKYHIRFSHFSLTHGGKEALSDKVMDNLILESIGLLVRTPNVPFELEIGEIIAVPFIDNKINVKGIKNPTFIIPTTATKASIITDEESVVTDAIKVSPETKE